MTNPSRVHINWLTEKAQDGSVLRTSIMVNINEVDVTTAVRLYRELKAQLEGSNASGDGRAIAGQQSVTKEILGFPECPKHGMKMVLRTRKSDGGIFFGCPMFEGNGCLQTSQYPANQKIGVK